ncbi:unnamed protein product [Sphagnum balticum]
MPLTTTGAGSGSGGFTPASLSNLVASLIVAQARSAGNLWQDTAQTIPAIASNDPVRVAVDSYSGVTWTAPSDAARPLLGTDGSGHWWLISNGTSTGLGAPNSSGLVTGAASLSFCADQTAAVNFSRCVQSLPGGGSTISLRNTTFYSIYIDNFQLYNPVPLVSNSSPHIITLSTPSSGPWSVWLDGGSLTVSNAVSGAFGQLQIGIYESVNGDPPWAGNFYGGIFAQSQWSTQTQSQVEAYLGALHP